MCNGSSIRRLHVQYHYMVLLRDLLLLLCANLSGAIVRATKKFWYLFKAPCRTQKGCSIDYVFLHMIRSQRIKNAHKPLAAKKVYRAVLGRCVAFLSSLFPPPTFSVVESESDTNCSICADCVARLLTSNVCSSAISTRDFSAVL